MYTLCMMKVMCDVTVHVVVMMLAVVGVCDGGVPLLCWVYVYCGDDGCGVVLVSCGGVVG